MTARQPDPEGTSDGSPTRKSITSDFASFLEAAPDAMIVVSSEGRIIAANRLALKLFDYEAGAIVGQPIELLVPDRFRSQHVGDRTRYSSDPHRRPMGAGLDLWGRRRDGSELPVAISLSPIAMPDGVLIMSAVRDMTDRRRLEEDIRRKNQVLEEQNRRIQEASRLKSEFLANMSHELRTPLNSIIGFAELLHDGRLGPVDATHQEYLGDILTSARHLLNLINDVLDLAKVESGKMEFFPEPVDLAELVASARDHLRTQASAKRIRVEQVIDPDLVGIVIDAAKLKQVLYNFLSNALKFTPESGRVTVRALKGEDESTFRIEVEDTGVGIKSEDLGRLFVEFQQLDAGTSKKFQGTGLGLALVRRMIEAQGGRVGVRSHPGSGSLFHVVLPRVADPAHVEDRPVPGQSSSIVPGPVRTILVIDDNLHSLKLAEMSLRPYGQSILCTTDPAGALRAVTEVPPDLLIVDLVMPGLNGVQFIERFRETAAGRYTPIIVWTVQDISPPDRARLAAMTQGIVSKREGGAAALVNAVRACLPAETSGAVSS